MLRPKVGEKVGIVGQRAIKAESQAPLCPEEIRQYLQEPCPTVFEYSEIDLTKINPEAQYANIANHLFRVDYLQQLINIQKKTGKYITPYHLAHKKVPYFDAQRGEVITPSEPNAWKVEHFIFDVFHFCPLDKFGVYVCTRDEFVPIKEKSDIA